jgi:hypothetical protein
VFQRRQILDYLYGGVLYMSDSIKITVSQTEYEDYLKSHYIIKNERISDAHFLDSIMSPEADFTKTSEGKHILEIIKAL